MAVHAERAVALAKLSATRPDLRTSQLLAAADSQELAETQAEALREQLQSQIELRRDQTWDKAELLRDQAHARADMMRAVFDVRRAQFEQARAQMASQIVIRSAANGRLIMVRPSVCSKTASRIAVVGSEDRLDRVEDSE